MLTKPSIRVLSALSALEGHPDFVVITEWLKASLQQLHSDSSRVQDDVLVRWNQGASQVLEDLLMKAQSARDVLNKSR